MDRVTAAVSFPGWRRAAREVAGAGAALLAVVGFGLGWALLESAAGAGALPCPGGCSLENQSDTSRAPAAAVPDPEALPRGGTWLVDGYNALHAVLLGGTERREWWTQASRAALVERAQRFQDPSARIWLVFDGPRPAPTDPDSRERVRVVFAPSADDWIATRVRAEARPSELVVVSLDRAVAARAQHRGARSVSPHRFLAACGETGDGE